MPPDNVNRDLKVIAAHLEALEETIIYKLLDRAQFCLNPVIYEPGKSGFLGEERRSLFEQRLLMQEQMDAQFGRFCVPEERPFNTDLPTARRTVVLPETGLFLEYFNAVNLTDKIKTGYTALLPGLCAGGTDGQYGSSVEHDVYALQAIARRIHYGALYVGESKFRGAPEMFGALVDKGDTAALTDALTRREVEEAIMMRVREKSIAVQARANKIVRHVIDPAVIELFYREYIIPLTKEGEVRYLLNRRNREA